MMFEHFGLKDIWPAIRKKWLLIVSFIVFFILIFSFVGINEVKNFLKITHNDSSPLYAASASYYVQPDLDCSAYQSMNSDFLKSLPDDYVSLMNTDVCADFIYKKISSYYSSDYIVKNSEISSLTDSTDSKIINIESVKKLYKINREKSTRVINIYTVSYTKELSEVILKECRNFIEENADSQIKNSHIEFMGETIKTIKSYSELIEDEDSSVQSENSDSNIKAIILIVVKNSVIPVVGLTACLLLIILFISAFHPTLNRKSDFCEYDVPIIGEIKD